ncbi:MAG: beta-N-acetylhexosaminidase [Acidobacteria bacterium]|nr:beta-N-acetylhexosaminidase [Acidobacteriota bacterium]
MQLNYAFFALALSLAAVHTRALAAGTTPVFPIPQEQEILQERVALNGHTRILVPEKATSADLLLARFLSGELADRYGLGVPVERAAKLPAGGTFIAMGTLQNPLVRQYCLSIGLQADTGRLPDEGYLLRSGAGAIVVAGKDQRGVFYGLQTLRQLIGKSGRNVYAQGARIRDWPYKPFRGIRLYVPGRENLSFFKRFLRDFMALYKFNTLIVEVNGTMRLDRHPEVNAGSIEFAEMMRSTRRSTVIGPNGVVQDSAHHDAADGGVLEKKEVADLVAYAREHHIEVIPEIPSLTHSYYLLTRHRELAEIQDAEWPDTYCPSNPKVYDLLFDVIDEYLEVIKPRTVHIGHDEWRMPINVCERCRGKEPVSLFAQDVQRIHGHLARKGVRAAIYGDTFVEEVRGKGTKDRVTAAGFRYTMPGALSPEQVRKLIPKDIIISNWFWTEQLGGVKVDDKFDRLGFQQVYGNMGPSIPHYRERSRRAGVLGGGPSSWVATTEANFGKDFLWEFLGCANLLWSEHWPDRKELLRTVQSLMPAVRRNLSGVVPPSEQGDEVAPIAISRRYNLPASGNMLKIDLSGVAPGKVAAGAKIFEIAQPGGATALAVGVEGDKKAALPLASEAIHVGQDVTSLLFLHATARPGRNDDAYRLIYNFDDTADLLGWYEIVYEDGYVMTAPIRYGVNILEWNWDRTKAPYLEVTDSGVRAPVPYAYAADAVAVGSSDKPASFFAFEWTNPRLGKVVKEVRLKGTSGFRNYRGQPTGENAIILAGVSAVRARPQPGVK